MEAAGGINWVCPPNTPLRWAIIILILPWETETQLVSHPRSHQGRASIKAPLVLTDALSGKPRQRGSSSLLPSLPGSS